LAQRVGVSVNSVSLIETGQVDPRASHIKAIAKALGVSTDCLFGEEDDDRASARVRERVGA
jgi:transcriptional regulator with XRE-family HTH domain